MTGFGSASSEDGGGWALRVEVRSVNHRHLLVKARLPADFAHLEADVERLVRKELERGAVTVHLHATRLAAAAPATIDEALALRYRRELERIAAATGLEGVTRLETLIALPGVVRVADPEGGAEGQGRRVLALLAQALEGLRGMRRAEGEALAADLAKHAVAIEKLVARIGKRMPGVVRDHQAALRRRVAELLQDGPALAVTDLAREIALLADRLDVSEELARLGSHLAQLESLLERGGTAGRKLDFLVQEVFREINTIGAKCNDARVAHWVVDAKAHAERLREQVQNVE